LDAAVIHVERDEARLTLTLRRWPTQKWIAGIYAFIALDLLGIASWAQFFRVGPADSAAPFWVIGLLFLLLFARKLHGWRTSLIFDRAAGELRCRREPALLPPRQKVFPLARVARAEVKSWLRHRNGGFMHAVSMRLRLVDSDGRTLFVRRLFFEIEERVHKAVKAVNDFLGVGIE
jgi:hypothetical protein